MAALRKEGYELTKKKGLKKDEQEKVIDEYLKPTIFQECDNIYESYKDGKAPIDYKMKLQEFLKYTIKNTKEWYEVDARYRNNGILIDGVQVNIQIVTGILKNRFGQDVIVKHTKHGTTKSDYSMVSWRVIIEQQEKGEKEWAERAQRMQSSAPAETTAAQEGETPVVQEHGSTSSQTTTTS